MNCAYVDNAAGGVSEDDGRSICARTAIGMERFDILRGVHRRIAEDDGEFSIVRWGEIELNGYRVALLQVIGIIEFCALLRIYEYDATAC